MAINLLAKLGLDSSGFATGLAKAEVLAKKSGARIGNSMKTQFAAFFGTAAVAASVKSVLDFSGKISDLSKRTFLSKRALQEFDYIAQQTGTSLDAFVMAEQKLAQAQQAAIRGGKDQADIFARFGFSIADLRRLNPHQLFILLSDAIGKTDLSGRQLDEVLRLMGKSAGDVIPAMKDGFSGMIERANQLGLVLKDDVIDRLDEAGDKINEAKLRLRGPAASAAVAGADVVEASILATKASGSVLGQVFKAWRLNNWSLSQDLATGNARNLSASFTGSTLLSNPIALSQAYLRELDEQTRVLEKIETNTRGGTEGLDGI